MNLLQASYYKVQSDIHAGGPGSGRKPEFGSTKGSYDEKELNKMHDKLTKAGYTYNHSVGDKLKTGTGIRTHTYYKGNPKSDEGRKIAEIFERGNGRHTMSSTY